MKRAILAGIDLNNNHDFDLAMDECVNLCEAGNIEVVARITQNSRTMDKNTAFRSGKLDELKAKCEELDVDVVVFLNNLNLSILSKINEYINYPIIDRTSLILDIFKDRAHTKEAIIQTEMARLKYNMPRYLKEVADTSKERGGVFNNRGSGETKVTLVERKMERRISDLRRELSKIEKERIEKANKRKKTLLKRVALVGYTNAGKSSFMNSLLEINDKEDKNVFEKDMLFATLDTSVRKIKYQNYEFLLYDTVGFVSDLPHDLIEAFESTLSAAKEADLLLNIIDYSNPHYDHQIDITKDTLKKIGIVNTPIIDVYNKVDLKDNLDNYRHEISTKTRYGLDKLLDDIIDTIYPNELELNCMIPYKDMNLINEYQNKTKIEIIEYNDLGAKIKIKGPCESLNIFKVFQVL